MDEGGIICHTALGGFDLMRENVSLLLRNSVVGITENPKFDTEKHLDCRIPSFCVEQTQINCSMSPDT